MAASLSELTSYEGKRNKLRTYILGPSTLEDNLLQSHFII